MTAEKGRKQMTANKFHPSQTKGPGKWMTALSRGICRGSDKKGHARSAEEEPKYQGVRPEPTLVLKG